MSRIKLAVSSCLMGYQVRFDGGHKNNPFISQTLSEHFDLVPLCPELAIGLGVPRQTLRLAGDVASPRVIGSKDPTLDVTEQLKGYGKQMANSLTDICGYIVKKHSPSCGMERVKVYVDGQMPQRQGRGVYIQALMEEKPWLPVEEEGRLNDPLLRENFFERVFVLHRWQKLMQKGLSADGLVKFHTSHKYLTMSRGQHEYRRLGRMVAKAGCEDIHTLGQRYFSELMVVLKKRASRERHCDVLFHLIGYFKGQLSGEDKQELVKVIHNYRQGFLPLIVPVTLLRHHLRRLGNRYLEYQHYFAPYPDQLMLRNQV